ncbi:Transposase IS4 [Popillia japonica]|uniref:Transposase IS4 n=1 Tax=Popillia japonica TaxID=7064 RepID=A0AAW1IXZ4_POPJA
MIPFTGTTSLRQYVKNKPNPESLKSIVLATPGVLVLDFIVSQGSKTWPGGKSEPASCKQKLTSEKEIMKGVEVHFKSYILRQDNKICITKWCDNKPVLMASTSEGSHPITSAQRWDKGTKTYIQVPRPNVITAYNTSMRGVDLNDRMIAYYRIAQKTRKLPVYFMCHFIDLALVNSWIEYIGINKTK